MAWNEKWLWYMYQISLLLDGESKEEAFEVMKNHLNDPETGATIVEEVFGIDIPEPDTTKD